MEDFSYRAQKEIPNFGGIKFSSKDLPDMIGVVFSGVNVLFGCDEVTFSFFVIISIIFIIINSA